MAHDTATIERWLDGPDAMQELAARLALHLTVGDVVTLQGELGTGKTTFARGLIGALGGGDDVPSPTFTLAQVFDLADPPVWHFDFYRLNQPDEAFEIGIEEAFATAISIIEWPERAEALLPADRLHLHFRYGDAPEQRRVTIAALGTWNGRTPAIAKDLA